MEPDTASQIDRDYFLDYLREDGLSASTTDVGSVAEVEYRFLCSGELLRKGIEGTEYWRHDATPARMLLAQPFEVFVSAEPFNAFPQELTVRFSVPVVARRVGRFGGSTFRPDEPIARDLAAVLALLLRRPIAIASKVRERFAVDQYRAAAGTSFASDRPEPLAGSPRLAGVAAPSCGAAGWRPPLASIGGPPPVAVDGEALLVALRAMERSKIGVSLLRAARLYAAAIDLIGTRPEIAYLLLVASAEAMAGEVFRGWRPPESQVLSTKKRFIAAARAAGVEHEVAKKLALEASAGNDWISRKFSMYLAEYGRSELSGVDQVFPYLDQVAPREDQFEEALVRVYRARSSAVHAGEPLPVAALVGTSDMVPTEAIDERLLAIEEGRAALPPITWLERLVGAAHRQVLLKDAGLERPVAVELPVRPDLARRFVEG